MTSILDISAVQRVRTALAKSGVTAEIVALSDSARSAAEAAAALGIEVGQVASSIVFKLPNGNPLLVVTSGRHRVDTELVAKNLGAEKLHRADAEYVKAVSGFSIGGVSPVAWVSENSQDTNEFGYPVELTILIDEALREYKILWAAAGHPHAVFPTTFLELQAITGARSMKVGG